MRECNKLWFVYYFFTCTSLCGQRSAKKPTSIACWIATLFASPQKAWQKRLCHMVASRRESHFSVLTNVYRWLNMEIEQLANLKRTLRILANEWLVQWFQGFKNVQLFTRQIVPRRNLIVPHEMSVKIRRERRLLIANFLKTIIQLKKIEIKKALPKRREPCVLRY